MTKTYQITLSNKERLMLISAAKCNKEADLTVELDGSSVDTYGPITDQTIKEWDLLIQKLDRRIK